MERSNKTRLRQSGAGGQKTDTTKETEAWSVLGLHSFTENKARTGTVFYGKRDKSVSVTIPQQLVCSHRVCLPSSVLAGRHWVLKIWANRARTSGILGLISILRKELQLLTALRLELHSELWRISSGSFAELDCEKAESM